MITNDGLALDRDWLAGDSVNAPSHIAVGTGPSYPIATNTALETEVLRKVFSTKTKSGDGKITFEMTVTTAEANGSDLSEIGIFNAASVGDLLNRIVYTPIAKTSAFELKYEIEVEVRRKS